MPKEGPSDAKIQDMAAVVYEKCTQEPPNCLFAVEEIQDLIPGQPDPAVIVKVINTLLEKQQFTALDRAGQALFRAVPKDTLEKMKNMNSDENILYAYIQGAAREGIWSKTLKTKSNMHATTMTKCLKTLEQKRYIKVIQSVKYPTRKIYMLYELTPSSEVSGGPWFTDAELDNEFVNELLNAVFKFIQGRSVPKGARGGGGAVSYPANYTGYPSLRQVYLWVKNSGVTEVDLAEADVKSLVDVLVYDGRVERVLGGSAYKAANKLPSANGFTESPCGRCPVFNLCQEGGPVSASNCKYFEEWLSDGL